MVVATRITPIAGLPKGVTSPVAIDMPAASWVSPDGAAAGLPPRSPWPLTGLQVSGFGGDAVTAEMLRELLESVAG